MAHPPCYIVAYAEQRQATPSYYLHCTSYTVGCFCLRQSGTFFCWCSVFLRRAQKNRTQEDVKYHAAVRPERSRRAGRICSRRRRLRKSCSLQNRADDATVSNGI